MGVFEHPLEQGPLSLRILQRIKEALINKELRPGDYLPTEIELSQKLGVSKTSVREAVKMLQALGVVEVTRRHGTRVCQHPAENIIDPLIFQLILDYEAPKDLVELRMMFEPAFTVVAMKKARPEDLEKIARAIKKALSDDALVDSAAEKNDKMAALRLDHLNIQHQVVEMYEGVYEQCRLRK